VAKDSGNKKEDDWLIPVWNYAGKRFYQRLNQAAKSTGLTRLEVLEQGIELVVEREKRQNRPSLKKLSDDDIEDMRASLSHFAKQRWLNTPPAERKRIGKMLADARRTRKAERAKTSRQSGPSKLT
jgi:acyl-CoA reductase-like NAD-dependent aldehyde dehydrogenase